jgi:hypothetical protein
VLAAKTPDLDKYFHLLEEEAKKAPKEAPVEKIKTNEDKLVEKKEEDRDGEEEDITEEAIEEK